MSDDNPQREAFKEQLAEEAKEESRRILREAMQRLAAGEDPATVSKETGVLIHTSYGGGTPTCKCRCPDGLCEHVWDGPSHEFEDGCGWEVTCSRCGMGAMQHSMWTGP